MICQLSPWCLKIMCCSIYLVIKWKHFPRYWPFLQGIHRSPVANIKNYMAEVGRWKHMFLLCNPWTYVGITWNLFGDDDVIKWKHFPRYWPFLWGIHRWPVNSPHKGQWRGVLMFSLICVGINGWVNNCGAGDLRRHRAHYDVIVMLRVPVVNKSSKTW